MRRTCTQKLHNRADEERGPEEGSGLPELFSWPGHARGEAPCTARCALHPVQGDAQAGAHHLGNAGEGAGRTRTQEVPEKGLLLENREAEKLVTGPGCSESKRKPPWIPTSRHDLGQQG